MKHTIICQNIRRRKYIITGAARPVHLLLKKGSVPLCPADPDKCNFRIRI